MKNRKVLSMIKKQVKCPRCGKVLLRMYSTAVISVTCKCGYCINLKQQDTKESEKPVR